MLPCDSDLVKVSPIPKAFHVNLDIESGSIPEDSSSHSKSSRAKGVDVTFKDISFTIPSNQTKGDTAHLLNGVSGFIKAGSLVALLGPSGSGKTTLLDILSGRKTTGTTKGDIKFGGITPSKAFLQRFTGVVEQFDTLIGTLTVEEMILYTAYLKRPVDESKETKEKEVDNLLKKLGLNGCRSVRIGDSMQKGISGGQAKRTNIGIALISDPRVLFLDEPTSGLDSFTANEVITLLRQIADEGTSVCATIHSPSAYSFKLFDSVQILLQGHTVYFGPAGESVMSYANIFWKGEGKQQEETDAELLVSLITNADRRGDAKALADTYSTSQIKKDSDAELEYMLETGIQALGTTIPAKICSYSFRKAKQALKTDAEPANELLVSSSMSTPWWNQLLTLLRYRSSYNYRSSAWLGPRVMDKLIFSLVILTLYLGIGDDITNKNVVNLGASLFMWCVLPAFGAASYVPSIILERRLFIRERADGLYTVFSYLLYKIMEEITLALFSSIVFSSIVFYGVGYQGSFGLFWSVYYITLCNGIVLAYLIAGLSPNMDVANAALPAYVTTLLFFAGQLMTFGAMPPWWRWYSYIDFLRYAWGSLMINQFSDGRDIIWTEDNQTVLQYFGLESVNKSAYCGYESLFFIVFALMAYLVLSFVRHHQR